MKKIGFISIVLTSYVIGGCNNATTDNRNPALILDTCRLPGIPSEKTLHFNAGNVYYQSMDEPGKQTFKCFSWQQKRLVWSKDINQMGINEGAITVTGEYVVPTLSDTVYLIAADGKEKILKLEDRCKINPLAFKNTFILQDRGIGLKSFDARSLQELWVIRQNSHFTMSQPLLLDSSIVYVLDDQSIQSSNAANGKLNWRILVTDTFALYDLYGADKDRIFVLSTNLKKDKQLTAINLKNGGLLWQVIVDRAVNELERDMIVTGNSIFCRGDSSVFSYSIQTGRNLRRYDYKSGIATNLVADKGENVLFGLADNTLMKIDDHGNDLPAARFKSKLDRLYRFGDDIFLYSYPDLYVLDTPGQNK